MKVAFDLPQCNLMNNLIPGLDICLVITCKKKEIGFWLHWADVIFIMHYSCDIWSHQNYDVAYPQKTESLLIYITSERVLTFNVAILKNFDKLVFFLMVHIVAAWDLVNETVNFPLGLIKNLYARQISIWLDVFKKLLQFLCATYIRHFITSLWPCHLSQ